MMNHQYTNLLLLLANTSQEPFYSSVNVSIGCKQSPYVLCSVIESHFLQLLQLSRKAFFRRNWESNKKHMLQLVEPSQQIHNKTKKENGITPVSESNHWVGSCYPGHQHQDCQTYSSINPALRYCLPL